MTAPDSKAELPLPGKGVETPDRDGQPASSDPGATLTEAELATATTPQVPAPVPPQPLATAAGAAQAPTAGAGQGRSKKTSTDDAKKTGNADPKSGTVPAVPAAALSIPEVLAAAGVLASPPPQAQPVSPAQQPQPPVLQTADPAGARSVSPLADAPGRQVQAAALLAAGPKLTRDDGPAKPDAPSPAANPNSFAMMIGQDATKAMANAQQPSASLRLDSSAASVSTQVAATDMDSQQLDALVRDIAAISGKSARAEFRLAAEHLGSLDVRLHTSDAGVSVAIRTQSEQSQSTVAQAQHQLTDDMRANGLKVASTSVMLGHGGADRQRQDRAPAPAPAQIEVASGDREQSEPLNQRRPVGRYA
jgi:flagellar hook-length control protein FliK